MYNLPPNSKDIYLVSDVHGNFPALENALRNAGLIDDAGKRTNHRDYIVQIGDLANCVQESVSNDLYCLDTVGTGSQHWLDMLLIGNHEMPYLDPLNTFSGFHFDRDLAQMIRRLNADELIGPCLQVGETLISHAGISREFLSYDAHTAEGCAAKLEDEWITNPQHEWFSSVGVYRGGTVEVGGMLWCDFDREFTPAPFPQIVGHTPGHLRMRENTLCIDTGAKYGGIPTVIKVV